MKRFFTIFIVFIFILPVCAESADYAKAEEESRIGNLFDLYLAESFVILKDDNLTEKVTKIVEKIAKASDNPDIKYLVRIINDPLPVVSSFPGYIYISSGMLDILENEDELASVVAHAIAHAIEKDQYDTYMTALKMKKIAFVTGSLMPFLMFAGAGVGAIAAGGITGVSISAVGSILLINYGAYAVSSTVQAITTKSLPERKVTLNRLGPYLHLPDIKSNLTVLVFFGEIYGGYNEDNELKADELSIRYLNNAGYKPEALVSVFRRLLELRNKYISNGYVSHLFVARPGLEKRIENADQVIKDNK